MILYEDDSVHTLKKYLKRIFNNKIIEINSICPIKLLKLQGNLAKISREFNHRSKEKNYKEMMFNIMGRNLNKYHRFIQGTLKEFKPKTA